ncbi:hypothetical protein Pcinc_024020 [Petrolisthes cinctipes]|uniref:Uncharacterized protein n=1 Tax=Petrolisthes cinctipes TaxID=88211 RepID=A0AAE1FBQ8_PETCI|nr:hypothetical protein Pcinc_024020 [Petrolisthes cinctipes]
MCKLVLFWCDEMYCVSQQQSRVRAVQSPSSPESEQSRVRAVQSPSSPESEQSRVRAVQSPSSPEPEQSRARAVQSPSSPEPEQSRARAVQSPSSPESEQSRVRAVQSPSSPESEQSRVRAVQSPSSPESEQSRVRAVQSPSSPESEQSRVRADAYNRPVYVGSADGEDSVTMKKIVPILALVMVLVLVTEGRGPFHKMFPTHGNLNLPSGADAGDPLFLTPLLEAGKIQTGADNAPVVIWLQGGPGGSSLFGLFTEHGPFSVDSKLRLVPRQFAWTKTLNVLYVDNPVGTGLAIGDGLCDPVTMTNYGDFLYQVGLIDSLDQEYFKNQSDQIVSLINKQQWLQAFTLLDNYLVLIYNGQLDIIIGYTLTENFLDTLDWKMAGQFQQSPRYVWKVEGQVAGYVREVPGFVQVLVRNAGHMIPYDQPKWAFDMINRFTAQKSFA